MTPVERYFRRIASAVENLPDVSIETYNEQILSATRANLRFRLRWPTAAILEVSEAIEVRGDALVWLSYRYHFQQADRVIRYDNAPHHPELSTHPEHRHLGNAPSAASRPDVADFLQEVLLYL